MRCELCHCMHRYVYNAFIVVLGCCCDKVHKLGAMDKNIVFIDLVWSMLMFYLFSTNHSM